MTSSSDFVAASSGPTTVLPGAMDIDAILPELTTTQERYDHGFRRGYTAGYAHGARQAQAAGEAELAAQKAAWGAAQAHTAVFLGQLASATEHHLQAYGPQEIKMSESLLQAAFELAEAVIGYELSVRPGRAMEIARSALANLPSGPVTIRVNPADQGLVSAAALGPAQDNVHIAVDNNIAPGGCVVTSGATTVDARLSEAIERARQAFCGQEQPGGGQ